MKTLRTCFNATLSYDSSNNRLIQEMLPISPIEYILENERVILLYKGKYVAPDGSSKDKFILSDKKFSWEIEFTEKGPVGIKLADNYLSALAWGGVKFVPHFDRAEKFIISTEDAPNLFAKNLQTYLDQHKERKIAFSCGLNPYPSDWFSTDINEALNRNIHYMDMGKHFSIPSLSFDFAHCEHGIEHLAISEAHNFIQETYRILKFGGILRLAWPSLDNWIKYYLFDTELHDRMTKFATETWMQELVPLGLASKAVIFNNALRNWGHQCVLDIKSIKDMLRNAGFSKVTESSLGISEHDAFKNIDKRKDWYSKVETTVLEAVK